MSNKTLEEKIAVMQHYLNGGKVLINSQIWSPEYPPIFNWEDNDYSIYEEPKTKPSIDWKHVSPKFNYLATDENGITCLFEEEPSIEDTYWYCDTGYYLEANVFSSFVEGTCDWKDSLVKRPE